MDLMPSDCVRSPRIAPLLIRYYPIAPLLIRYYPLSNGGALVLPFARTATPRGRLISPGLAADEDRALLSTPARTEPSRDAHDDARDESSGASGGLRGETRGGTGKSLEGREAISARDDALLAAEVLGARISRSRACEDASSY